MQIHNVIYTMISIKEAIDFVKKHSKPLLKETTKPVLKAGGYTLYRDIKSPINMPPFRQSAMDGYAVHLHNKLTYNYIGEIKAGDDVKTTLKPGDAVRIFTGAAVPDTANAVMMQEKATVNGNKVVFEINPNLNQNIRDLGEQVKTGATALKKDTKLTPAAIGYLTTLGITQVSVYKKPNIALVTTGNELVKAGQPLPYGKIYESNATMLQSALYNLKFYDITCHTIEDDYNKTKDMLHKVIKNNDLILITGGISVGDYDFVGKALLELQTEQIFYKVKQKPGKPLFFGKKENALIFALPGNPAAALTCFYIYVHIALQKMMNRTDIELPRIKAKSKSEFFKKGDRPQFLKAIHTSTGIEILEGQSSAMLQTFAVSNALVYVPHNVNQIHINDELEVILLPQ